MFLKLFLRVVDDHRGKGGHDQDRDGYVSVDGKDLQIEREGDPREGRRDGENDVPLPEKQ